MNTLEALRKCYEYFLDESHAPGYRNNECVYYANGSDVVRCAIGCLLPPELEEAAGQVHGGLWLLQQKVPATKELFAAVDSNALSQMQQTHDNWAEGCTSREDFLFNLQFLMRLHETDGNKVNAGA